jgi:hypothetical protein
MALDDAYFFFDLALEDFLAETFAVAFAFLFAFVFAFELLVLACAADFLDEARLTCGLRTGRFQSTALSARNLVGITIMPSA